MGDRDREDVSGSGVVNIRFRGPKCPPSTCLVLEGLSRKGFSLGQKVVQ